MDGPLPLSIPPFGLYVAIATEGPSLVIGIRRVAGFDADEKMLVGAIRRHPDEHALLARGMIICDALCSPWGDTHDWKPEPGR